MTGTAVVLLVAYLLVAFGWRSWAQYHRTGDTGFRGFSGGLTTAEGFAGWLLIVSLVALICAPLFDWLGLLSARRAGTTATGSALALMAAGFVVTVAAQRDMGLAWRVGVAPGERTKLVTHGLFRAVRNPVFTGIGLFALGFAVLVPNVASLAALLLGAVGLQLQVRRVEEPFLLRAHGDVYRDYAARAGRFVPWLGRLRI